MRPTRTVVIPAALVSALVILALVVMQLRIGAPTAQTPTAQKDKPAAQQEERGLPRGKSRNPAWKARAKPSRRPWHSISRKWPRPPRATRACRRKDR